MFAQIFGGEAFKDWYAGCTLPRPRHLLTRGDGRIGEISMMRDMEKSMEISTRHEEENAPEFAAAGVDAETAAGPAQPSAVDAAEEAPAQGAAPAGTTTTIPERPKGVPTRLAITDRAEEEARLSTAGVSDEEKALREKQRKKGLTKEQREELAAFELERRRIRDERVEDLAKKLINRVSLLTETDKGEDVTASFRGKMQEEVENLKMESFGLEMLHAIGATYTTKAATFIKSQKPIIGGVSGFFSRLKDKGTLVRDTWGTVSSAIQAQLEIQDMAKAEERGGEEWTDERKVEYERRVTGKILAAAWRGSRLEIQSVLRDVCDRVLYDKTVKLEKRMERAHALIVIGEVFSKARRNADEEGEFLAFEQLMAEAAQKKDKHAARHAHKRQSSASGHVPTE